ncbi:MAG: VanZ family protein [Flavobacteriales bacterium]|nr:VanZ family protein [Flavobacteriales bacterium]
MDLFSLDKPVHALLFAVLTVLIPRAWNIADTDGRRAMRVYWTAAVMATAYGVSTEWMQHAFVPDRTADVNDMIANALGALLGVVYLKRRDGARNSTKGRKDV